MKDMKETVVDSVRDLVKEEIEKARLKPEQDKKDEEIEDVEEDKKQGSLSLFHGHFKECCYSMDHLWLLRLNVSLLCGRLWNVLKC